ncbi:MAG: zinc-dependent alcohol dehydrogenase family protein [Hyphomicrobiaceae bacterium]
MKAMVFEAAGQPLKLIKREAPEPGPGQVLVEISACAVCRTDLHVVDGDLTEPKLPIIPGHEIVGRVISTGEGVDRCRKGERIGIPWLGHTCGSCSYCRNGQENLCDEARFTGYQIDGGFATHCVADAAYCFTIPDAYDDVHAAPLLCAGLIGYRSLKATDEAKRLGIYGFGAAAHIVAQIARHEGRELFAFTRPGDVKAQDFARSLGAVWAGRSDELPPKPLEAAIIFAPVGSLLPQALRATQKGGTVVLGGIHMSDIPAMPYSILWGERIVRSIANLTRQDAVEFMSLAARFHIDTTVEPMPLAQANEALRRIRDGELTGAAVLVPELSDKQ